MTVPRAPLLLDCPVRTYAWGSPTSLPELLGRTNPAQEPWAELWMGAHPASPSLAVLDDERRPLDELFAEEPLLLGEHDATGTAPGELPFLFKVLAIARALSIQCHPDEEQARAGFAREEAAGVPRDAPGRSYKDPHAKPELLVALQPISALCGFRPASAITAAFAARGLSFPGLDALVRDGDAGLKAFFTALLSLSTDDAQRLLTQATRATDTSAETAWVRRLAEQHPGDASALAPLILQLVELAPGEGLFLEAGLLHAYLEGVGLEVMGNSDNVLRAGLTPKHIDVPELLRIGRFAPGTPAKVQPERVGVEEVWPTPTPAFRLSRVRVEELAPVRGPDATAAGMPSAPPRADILLVTSGSCQVRADGGTLPLARGQVALVPATAGGYTLQGGPAEVWRARAPSSRAG